MFNTQLDRTRGVRSAAAAIFVALVFICASSPLSSAMANGSAKSELNCLATAIYFEARGESERGQLAVAEVIIARADSGDHPETICGVVYEGSHRRHSCQFSFACDGRSDVARDAKCWERAKRIAAEAMEDDDSIVHGATFFHVKNIHPRWASRMVRVARVGSHIFYRPRRA